ncbi:MAG: AraC family transcriptional regulator [Chitinophagaceae bacterium]|nr:MAG: AraC family transcriptional regulator [Chitinophagaceae bacterium]
MTPSIQTSGEKKLIGNRLVMSFSNYKVSDLWKGFASRRKEIKNSLTNTMLSVTVYSQNHFVDFKPTNEFEKWAAVEVSDFDNVPSEMETLVLPAGLYAVFYYKGLNTDNSVYQYIFGTWLPGSDYMLDNRPHFEVLGEKYKNNDPDSEEEIWIPIKPKSADN